MSFNFHDLETLLAELPYMYGGGDTNTTWNGWWNVKQHDSYSKIVIELRVFDICWNDGIMSVKFYVVLYYKDV